MSVSIGWDVGGAHLKAARAEGGRVVAVAQVACPLWQGVDRLREAIPQVVRAVGGADRHRITTTGELSDAFPSRKEGVRSLAEQMAEALGEGRISLYAGPKGFVTPASAASHADDIASANWHATASFVGSRLDSAMLVDMGSTTTDIVPIARGQVVAAGYSDQERLRQGELVYTGLTRTFLMAVCDRVPFRGRWTPLMNEYFASMADVYRVLGELDENADQHSSADGREKTLAASRARLARMIGADAGDASLEDWLLLARWFAEAQLRRLDEAVRQVLSAKPASAFGCIVGAGAGLPVVERLAARLGLAYSPFDSLIDVADEARVWATRCAPCVALALLAE
jgi:probable H4MPT-linked C1 transfer pathway protein